MTSRHRSASKSIRLFYSYSHEDETLRDELEDHLSLLKRQGLIKSWHDRRIGAGQDWKEAIDINLETSDVILCLVSAAFLASEYCSDREMTRALEKHETGRACVIPIIIRSVDWTGAPFSNIQALPKDARPVTSWPNRDEAWTDVAKGVREAIERLVSTAKEGETKTQGQPEPKSKAKSKRRSREKPVLEEAKREKRLSQWLSPSLLHTLEGHTNGIQTVAFSSDGSILASGSSGGFLFRGDCSIRLWDVKSGKLLRTFEGHESPVVHLAFSLDGTTLISSSGHEIWQWRVSDGIRLPTFEQIKAEGRFALSPDGMMLATTNQTESKLWSVDLWAVTNGERVRTLEPMVAVQPATIFSPDGMKLVAVLEDLVLVWRIADGSILRSFKLPEARQLRTGVALSPDGQTLAVCTFSSKSSHVSSVQLSRVSSGKLLRSLKLQDLRYDFANCVSFSPDGKTIAAGVEGALTLWRASDGKLLITLREHHGVVKCVAFSSDGKTFASGSDDRTIKIWAPTPSQDLFEPTAS